jgi:hypothetical protein
MVTFYKLFFMGRISTLIVSIACAMVLVSCSKEADRIQEAPQAQASSGQVLNVTLNTGEVYTLAYDKATELNIHKQAQHFRESTTTINNETGQVVYNYAPLEGFAGADEVTLSSIKKVQSYSSGCYMTNYGGEPNQMVVKAYTTIKINVVK